MTRQVHPLQESFNAGEFGERMHGRVQFDKYTNAGAVYQNIIPIPQGGWATRPGFRYIAAAKSDSIRPWLIPFVFSTTQSYVISATTNTFRFFKDQAQISAADISGSITNGEFGSNITGWTDNSGSSSSIVHDATADNMELRGNGASDMAKATQSVSSSSSVAHVIQFEVVGDPGDQITFRVGSTSGASDYHTDKVYKCGYHTVEFTPGASTFHIQFENSQNKTISLDNIAFIDNGPVELKTPYSESDLPDLSFAQSADTMYFCKGGSTRVYRLERYGNSSWSLVQVMFTDGPFIDKNTTATTLGLSATSGNGVTVTASAIAGINDDAGFAATDVGRMIRFEDAANDWSYLQIVEFTDTTHVKADIKGPNASATTATTDWRLGEWSDARGWPSVVGFIQQRLGFAATDTEPQKFWLSKSADIENFADEDKDGAVQDDSAIAYKFAALQVNTIRWLAMRKKPIIGTSGGNWTLRSDGAVLTPTDIAADFEVTGGTARIQPAEIRNRLVFAQAQGRKLMELADVIQENGVQGFDGFDLTILNDRVLTGGTTQIAYQQEPDSVIWLTRADGQLPALTYQPEQSVIGWSRHIHGGSFEGGSAVIESVATIPGQDGSGQFKDSSGRHEVWVAVKLEIGGSTKRFIECMEKHYNGEEDLQEEAFYVDSGLTLDSPVTVTNATSAKPIVITAASHGFSEGDTVRFVRVDGMTELNNQTYKVYETLDNSFEISGVDGVSISAISRANPGSVTAASHGFVTGDQIAIHGASGMTQVNGNGYAVTRVDANTFTIGVDTSGYGTYTIGASAYLGVDGTAFTTYKANGQVREKVSTISGLNHLEGQTVQILADGAVQTTKTVSSGAITLDTAASVVHVGLSYERRWKSLKLAYGAEAGSAIGQPKSIADVILVLLEAAEGSLSVASVDADGEGAFTPLDLRLAGQIDGQPVPFFTGEKSLGVEAGYDEDIRIVIKGTSPTPATVLGVSPELETTG